MAMEASSTLVIKVKYGDFLRRFNANVRNDKLDLNMGKLIEKICILFNFATGTELTLTYIDEDGETVTLVDDDDLRDVVEQALDPFRITVTLNKEKNSSPFIPPIGSSTPLGSPPAQQQFQIIDSGVSEILKTIPDPLPETFAKLLTDLVSKLSSSVPGITPGTAEIVDYFSKVGLSCLSQISELQARVRPNSQNDVPERATVTETKVSDFSKVDSTPLKAQSQGFDEKERANMVGEGYANEEKVNTADGPHLEPNLAFAGAHDRMKGDSLDGRTKHKFPCNFGKSPHPLIVPNHPSFSNFPGSLSSPFQAYECQHSGIPGENIPATQPPPASQAVSSGRNRSQNDVNGTVGEDNDYNRIDLPAIHPHHWPSTGLHDFHAQGHCSSDSQVHRGMEVNLAVSKLDSCFIVDVTMIDGTIITPSTPFTKIWRMRNTGTHVWPEKTRLVWVGGDELSNSFSVELQVPAAGLAVNQVFDVSVDFISPDLPGRYVSYWRMAAPSGQYFGQRVWVHIQVHATIEETQHGVMVNNALAGPEINNAVMDPLVEDSHPEEVFEPLTPLPNIGHDMKFPISDSSMVGSGATNLSPTSTSSILCPVTDQSDMTSPVYHPPYVHYPSPPPVFYPLQPAHVFYPPHPASVYTLPSSPFFYSWPPPAGDTLENTEELQGMEEVEKELLKELEEMGFNQVDLNKEILRFHEYDLQRTLKDLSGSNGWESDP